MQERIHGFRQGGQKNIESDLNPLTNWVLDKKKNNILTYIFQFPDL